jgi:hypothetical protein
MAKQKTGSKGKRKKLAVRASDAAYTKEERELIVRYVRRLKVPVIKQLLAEHELSRTGPKDHLIETLQTALDDEELLYADLVSHLDRVEPWGAQHVFVLGEPALDLSKYRTADAFEQHLRGHHASKPFRSPLPLALPETLTVSAIEHNGDRIRVIAVERREGLDRDDDYDQDGGTTDDGEPIILRGYVERTTRGLIILDWDLIQNHAILQITRMPSGWDYDDARDRFAAAVQKWLPMAAFPLVNLAKAISKLHEDEEKKVAPLHSHGIEYGRGGSRLSGTSASEDDSVLSDIVISGALRQMRVVGTGRRGNFYWHLDSLGKDWVDKTAHVIVFAAMNRVLFTTDNDEVVVQNVLADIRKAGS